MDALSDENRVYGLIGRNISYSFSRAYFSDKFEKLKLPGFEYRNFDIADISDLDEIRKTTNLRGLNVTIPYKESVIPMLDAVSKKASAIGAVNTIRILSDGKLKGYNTDWSGFKKAIEPMLQPFHKKALILGTGGSSKAIAFALSQMGIPTAFVSSSGQPGSLDYPRLNATTFDNYQIIINCTPLGTFPNTDQCPPIPYEFISKKHLAFDLVYNPEETEFMRRCKEKGATVSNGYGMLVNQAEKAWKIWNRI